ncbi:hypothetical protein A5733_04370 [Mycobacterium sp. NS-7484]|uniref:hypothetical protein n=1 Tax=Mycobacterium sp. NS-7484 TaxID=1834161 RepID=UPI00096C3B71|nr:hypothetical protein [Mycobacterium sp. NS-7484]OMC00352.1 hypothetical protein A5733_04370 [Mycobacterium sp. NS-7484]
MTAPVGNLRVEITGDASGFERQLQAAVQTAMRDVVREIQTGMQRGNQALNQIDDSGLRRAAQSAQQLNREVRQVDSSGLQRATRQAEQLRREAGRTADEIEEIGRAARQSSQQLEQGLTEGFEGAQQGAEQAGDGAGASFMAGFAPRIAQLGGRAGPIGVALAGVAAIGFSAGAVLAGAIADGMEQEATVDMFQARTGVDEATAKRFGRAAGQAYTDAFGDSIAENLDTARVALSAIPVFTACPAARATAGMSSPMIDDTVSSWPMTFWMS